jgi:hypothetical protein
MGFSECIGETDRGEYGEKWGKPSLKLFKRAFF